MASTLKRRTTTPTSIGGWMTPSPLTIRMRETLERAHQLMRDHHIRHLPVVMDTGRLIGMVSQRDLALIETLPDVDPGQVPVEDAMRVDLLVVRPGASLATVAAAMARRKVGSAVIVDGDRIVGVFTVTDACRALARLAGGRRSRASRSPGRRNRADVTGGPR